MVKKLLLAVTLVTVTLLVVFGSLVPFEGANGTVANLQPQIRRSDWSFEQLKFSQVPDASDLMTHTFSKGALDSIDREPHENNGRTLFIVAFERTLTNVKNIEFLINQVVGGSRSKDIDFIFVDTSEEGPFKCFPQLPNVLYVHRAKVGFDMCSYKVGLALVPPGRYK